jgi:HEAT repeat protein
VRNSLLAALCAGAALLLGGCGGGQEPMTAGGKPVAHWVEGLKSPDAKVRKRAVQKLANVGAADPAAVPALAGALKDRDAGVRAEAALGLLRIGPAAKEAAGALQEAARKDTNPTVRAHAGKALEKVQGGP